MEPTYKAENVENALIDMVKFDRRDYIRRDQCVPMGCGRENVQDTFYTELERREYQISGLCGNCQREIFASDDES